MRLKTILLLTAVLCVSCRTGPLEKLEEYPPSPTPSPIPSPTPAHFQPIGYDLETEAAADCIVLAHSDRDGDNEIYLLDFSAGQIIQLTANEEPDEYPSWSPDREKIIFVSARDGNKEIYLMNGDGSDPRRLTDNSEPDLFPCWAPDGKRIAYFTRRDGVDVLCLRDIEEGSPLYLTNFEDGKAGPTVFCPDGKSIYFGYSRLGKHKIYEIELPDGEANEIIAHGCENSRLVTVNRTDGLALIYVSGKGNQEDVWMRYIRDGRFIHITKNTAPDHSPTLSADGSTVVFSSRRSGDDWQLFAVSTEGKPYENEVRRLTDDYFNYYYPDVK